MMGAYASMPEAARLKEVPGAGTFRRLQPGAMMGVYASMPEVARLKEVPGAGPLYRIWPGMDERGLPARCCRALCRRKACEGAVRRRISDGVAGRSARALPCAGRGSSV